MAISDDIKERIAVFARELADELGEVDDRDALSWLDAIETQAVEIGDAVSVELLGRKSSDRPAADEQATCPTCGKLGRYEGPRERELISRRGPVSFTESEYFCPCCRKAFFPDDPRDRG